MPRAASCDCDDCPRCRDRIRARAAYVPRQRPPRDAGPLAASNAARSTTGHVITAGVCVICGPSTVTGRDGRCVVGRREAARRRARANPERIRDAKLRTMYRMTLADYREMEAAQGGGCAICGGRDETRDLSVDHDHACCPGVRSCGRCVRGLLCSACNRGVGYMRDNAALLRAAADYLDRDAAGAGDASG